MRPEAGRRGLEAGVSGRAIVLVLLLLGVAGVAGSRLYRRQGRLQYAAELARGEPERMRAFYSLLRMNGLWSLSQEYVYLPPLPGETAAYLVAGDDDDRADGGRLHVLRAVKDGAGRPGGGREEAVFIFSAQGEVLHALERARAVPLGAAGGRQVVALVLPEQAAPPWYAVKLAGRKLVDALRVRGRLALESPAGSVELGLPGEAAAPGGKPPLFRFDPEAGSFRGPPGGPGEPWEVDRQASPRFLP
jgi:hypothetical protein